MTRKKNTIVIGGRIRQARLARGMSMNDLAERVGVSKQMISKYELDLNSPTTEVYMKLRDSLGMPIGFFIKPLPPVTKTALFFRSLKSATSQVKDMVEARMEWLDDIFGYLDKYFTFPEPNLPDMSLFDCISEWEPDDIEQLATHTRRTWGLGLGPISDVTLLVEKNGIMVSRIPFDDHRVDACSQIRNQKPIIFLSNDKGSSVRSRFDVAHELGHLLMHSDKVPGDINKSIENMIESQAHHFARAFLLPADTFSKEVISPTLSVLQMLKPRWKVSIKMMIGRLKDLQLCNDEKIASLYKQYNARRWTKSEPLDDEIPFEQTNTLSQCINMLFENRIKSQEGILADIDLPPAELEQLMGLRQGTLTLRQPDVQLRLVK